MTSFAAQQRLIQALRDPGRYPHAAKTVRVLETHISWVLLAGLHAYKIKKAINLDFLDYTKLNDRRHYCEEEIRLNRRLAPKLYLDVVTIGGSLEAPRLSVPPAIEYAVHMRRFATYRMLNRLSVRGLLTRSHIDCLAETIARFHISLPPAPAGSSYGTPQVVHASVLENFEQLALWLNAADQELLASLRATSAAEYAAIAKLLGERREQGWVRECHGDLHLGNIVLVDDTPTPFDGIEFNANLRWIDVISEVAFLVMDLSYHGRADLGARFLDRYLQLTGDYAGVATLRYYLAYRALVRAKIAAIRARQPSTPSRQAAAALGDCRTYLALAAASLKRRRPLLVITHGLPGSGKTTVAGEALERLPAVRLRSDVERKRLHGLAPLESSRSAFGQGIYGEEATRRTYARLQELARGLLAAGYNVVVDAAFLRRGEREQFYALAKAMGVPFAILDVKVDPAILRRRLAQRIRHGRDASEADQEVLSRLLAAQEPLTLDEAAHTIVVYNEGELAAIAEQSGVWQALQRMLTST